MDRRAQARHVAPKGLPIWLPATRTGRTPRRARRDRLLMDATVCIPWRSQPDRVAAHHRVCTFWQHHGLPVVMADSDWRQPFQLSEARNSAVRRASTEVIIVADADTIPDIAGVLEAVELVASTPG